MGRFVLLRCIKVPPASHKMGDKEERLAAARMTAALPLTAM